MFGDDIGFCVVPREGEEVDRRAGGRLGHRDPPRAQSFGQLHLREPARHRERLCEQACPHVNRIMAGHGHRERPVGVRDAFIGIKLLESTCRRRGDLVDESHGAGLR